MYKELYLTIVQKLDPTSSGNYKEELTFFFTFYNHLESLGFTPSRSLEPKKIKEVATKNFHFLYKKFPQMKTNIQKALAEMVFDQLYDPPVDFSQKMSQELEEKQASQKLIEEILQKGRNLGKQDKEVQDTQIYFKHLSKRTSISRGVNMFDATNNPQEIKVQPSNMQNSTIIIEKSSNTSKWPSRNSTLKHAKKSADKIQNQKN